MAKRNIPQEKMDKGNKPCFHTYYKIIPLNQSHVICFKYSFPSFCILYADDTHIDRDDSEDEVTLAHMANKMKGIHNINLILFCQFVWVIILSQ